MGAGAGGVALGRLTEGRCQSTSRVTSDRLDDWGDHDGDHVPSEMKAGKPVDEVIVDISKSDKS